PALPASTIPDAFTVIDTTDTIASYAIAGGSFPDGLNFNTTTGAVTGTIDADASNSNDNPIQITATDSDGVTSAAVSFNWVVSNVAPVATANTADINEDGTNVAGNVITDDDGSGVDADGASDSDALSVSAISDGGVVGGAAATGAYGTLTIAANGAYTYTIDNGNATVQALTVGQTIIDTFTYTLSDGTDTDDANLVVTITGINDAPVSSDDSGVGFITDEDSDFTTGSVLANDSDADTGETGTLTIQSVDATSAAGALVTIVNATAGTIDYDPNGLFESLELGGGGATDTFDYVVVDAQGATSTSTVTIQVNPVNDAPVAVDDSGGGFSTDEDSIFTTGSVLSNDSDIDTGETATLSVNAVDATSAGGALVSDNGDGTFDYDPNGQFESLDNGGGGTTDTFDYTVIDAQGAIDTATVSVQVTPVNDAPVISTNSGATIDITFDENSTSTITTIAGDDVDADDGSSGVALTYDKDTSGGADHGAFTVDPSTGAVSFTTARNFEAEDDADGNNIYEVTVRANDDSGGSDTILIRVALQNVNEAPTASNLTKTVAYTEDQGTVNLVDIVVSDIDDALTAQNMTATLTLTPSAAGALTTSGAAIYNSGSGVWTITDTLANVNAALAAVDFVTGADHDTDSSITTLIQDQNGAGPAAGTITLDVTPVNDAPAENNVTQTVNYTEDASTVAIATIEIEDVDDADYAQTITATLTLADVAAGDLSTSGSATFVGGVWSVTDTLADVNSALAALAFEPAADYDTDTTISVVIADQDGAGPAGGTITLDVTPVNDAPTATNTTQTIMYDEDTNGVDALQPDIVITDVDDNDVPQTITVTLQLSAYLPITLSTPGSSSWNNLIGEWEITDTVANVNAALAALTFDAETDWDEDSSFTVQIMDQDFAGPVQGTVTLDVVPLNDDPVVNDQAFDVDENTANGTVIGTVVAFNEESVGCTPPDPGCQTITFDVTGTAFDIDDDGILTVKNVNDLDREATDSLVVIVTVTDDGTPVESDTANITVSVNPVNDNTPVGLIDAVSGSEQSTILFNVLSVGADLDADLPPETLFVSEVDGDPLKVGVAQELLANSKVVGELTINSDGSARFDATSDITVEEFEVFQVYTVSDGLFEDQDVLVEIELNPVNDNDPALTSDGTDFVINGLEYDEDTYSSSNELIVDLAPFFQDLDIDADGLLDSNTGEDNDSLILAVTANTNTTLVTTRISDTDLMIYSPPNEHGTSEITIRATDTADGGGNFVDLTFTLTVNSVNDAPVYIPGTYSDLVVLEDSGDIVIPLHAAFSDADIDADSNPLDDTRDYLITVQDVPNIPEVDTVHIDIPEADELTEDVGVPDPLGRTVEYGTDEASATIEIADDAHGEVTVTVRRQDSGVPDGTVLFAEETFTITVQGVGDDTPAAADDHYSTNPALIIDEDSDAIVIDVLANDYLGDAPAGVITAGQELQDSLGSDNAWRTTSRLTDRTNTGNYEIEFNGEVSCSADGCQNDQTPNTTIDGSGLLDNAIVYKPGLDFNGEDSFVYCIQDAFPGSEAPFTADRTTPTTDQRCATVTVFVNPVNDLPRVPGDTIYEMQQAELLIVPVEEGLGTVVTGVDNTHIDGIGCDPFDPGCNPGPSDPQPDDLFFYFQSAATASGEGELVAPFETDGSFNYRPNATFSGSDSFLVDVCEGAGMTADNCIFGVTVTITVESVSGDPEGSEEGAVEVDFDLANTPLELPIGPEANVLIVNDDSGSMDWDISTDQSSGVYFFEGTNNYVRYVMKATAGSSSVAASEEAAPGSGVWRLRNSVYNSVYYNPEIQYAPWKGLNASDIDFPNSNPNAALHNPLVTSGSNYATNLELPQDYTGRAVFTSPITCTDVCTNTNKSGNCTNYEEQCTGGNTSWQYVDVEDYWIPRYYTWEDKNGNTVLDATPSPHSDPVNSEGTLIEIRSGNTYPKHANRTDCITLPSNCTYAEELQNFANWFTYNRNREFTAKSALGQVVAGAENIRIGYAKLNSSSNIIDIETMNSSERTGAKADLLDAIYLTGSSGGTPLRRSLVKAGRFFECKSGGYFGHGAGTPGDGECPLYAAPAGNCQQNFTLLISDGSWNGWSPSYVGDADDPTDNDDPTDSNFDGGLYAGGTDRTLADVAMHFYERDLHTLANEVPTTARDRDGAAVNAFEDMNNEKMHQHMKTYTIGFGVDGVIKDEDVPTDYTQSFNWGNPFSSSPRKIDDMRHAAVNGRGQYLSAGNATGLADALLDAFDEFQKASGSASAVSFNSQEVQQDTLVFRAFYNTKNNTGDLIAQDFDVDENGLVQIGDEAWNAAAQLDLKTYDERVIMTLDRSTNTGIPFRPLSLNSDQRALFISDGDAPVEQQNLEVLQKVNYLRGDDTNERPAGNFRERPGIEGKLGDIVHSAPTFISPPNRAGREFICLEANDSTGDCELYSGWAPGYADFQVTWADRADVVYVAANDGMLHGFDAVTGDELMAYVPDNLMTGNFSNKISNLLNYEYTHEYFVDSSPAVNDVHIDWDNDGDKEWRTVVVNGQGAGAKAYFALDVTDPSKFTEATADQITLWEFTDADDAYPVVDNNPDTPLTNADSTMRMDLQAVPQPVKDLGYTLGVPTLAMSNVRDPDGTPRWIAAFGNGYNSTAGIAKMFVLFLDGGVDGVWCHPDKKHNTVLDATPLPAGCTDTDTDEDYDFVKLDTTFGTFLDDEGNNLPNGLGEVRLIDFDGNGTADYGYAGDMQGNLFRFNMSSDDFLDWSVTKIFEAKYKPGTVDETIQPITTQALAITHPTEEEGIILMFGTGAYMRTGDATDESIQSIYGIWDRLGPEEILKSELVEQWYTGINDSTQGQVRVLSDNPVDYSIIENRKGWFIDLDTPAPETPIPTGEPTGDPQFPGERAIRNIQVRGGLAFTASVFPRPAGSCVGQAGGALLSFCPDTGSSECFINQVFDLNNDGSFNASDNLADDPRTGAGVILTNETPPTDSAFIGSKIVTQQGTDLTVIDTNTSYGANTGRTSWRRLEASY
ncbi:MAG: tandem-95 repeat protein, partial [Pseudomonadales bacterium]|nr:tandem-95 repeat protein [Pseudomonadales bacterium]